MVRVRLRYRKAMFLPNLILLSVALVLLNIFFALSFFKDAWTLLISTLVSGFLLILLGVSPFLTDHVLTHTLLELRQGWYFRARIPLSNIEKVQIVERGRLRTGVFFELSGDALYVTTQRNDLIMLTLRSPQRFGFAWWKRARRVFFDTLDRNELLRRVAEKTITPASPDQSS